MVLKNTAAIMRGYASWYTLKMVNIFNRKRNYLNPKSAVETLNHGRSDGTSMLQLPLCLSRRVFPCIKRKMNQNSGSTIFTRQTLARSCPGALVCRAAEPSSDRRRRRRRRPVFTFRIDPIDQRGKLLLAFPSVDLLGVLLWMLKMLWHVNCSSWLVLP